MAVFAFMCHHSVPSIILPLADKRKTLQVVLVDYVIVLLYCGIIVFSAVVNKPASAILPLYTLNFSDYSVTVLAKFLSLYPVFTLSSNFPLICITLRNNLMALFPISKVMNASIERFNILLLFPVFPPPLPSPASLLTFDHRLCLGGGEFEPCLTGVGNLKWKC